MLVARLLPRRVKEPIALALACGAGAALALQARINGALSQRLGPALVAALVSFAVGLAVVCVVLGVTGRWTSVRALRSGHRRLWWFGGGLCGAFFVASSSYAVPVVGVALLFVCQAAGQLTGGLFVDRSGIAPGGRLPVTKPRLASAALAIGAVLLSTSGKHVALRLSIVLLALMAGLLSSVQQAANGHIRRHSDEILVAVLVNFAVGGGALLLVCWFQYAQGTLGPISWSGEPLWLFLGGPLGVAFVALTASTVRLLGVLRLTLAVVAGQLIGAVLLDLFWSTTSRPSAQLYAGVALVLVAVAIAGRGARVVSLRRPATQR